MGRSCIEFVDQQELRRLTRAGTIRTEGETLSDAKKIDIYIEKHEKWKDQLVTLRDILNSSELVEAVKWGSPSYILDNNILISLVGFKNHCAIWLHQGVFLEDAAHPNGEGSPAYTSRGGPSRQIQKLLTRS